MKRIAINVNFQGVDYLSDYSEMSEEQEEQLRKLLIQGAKNELNYLKFNSANKSFYFPGDIIKQSILSLVYDNQ